MSEDTGTPAAPLTEEQRNAEAAARAQAHRDKFAESAGSGDPAPADPPADEPEAHVKPDHVPEKYWNKDTGEVNYEAWNKAHAELETKFHQASKDDKPADGSEETPASDKDATDAGDDEATKAILETPAAQKAAENYAQNGELSEDDYAALEKQGIGRDLVDTYIAGQNAKATSVQSAAYEPAGGEENYTSMIAWAAENLSDGEKKAFNTQMTTGDPEVIRAAVTGLYGRYSQDATVEGERIGGNPPSTNSSTFASRAEMTAAINKVDPATGRRLYDTDPAYRNEVARKIGNSRRAGSVNF